MPFQPGESGNPGGSRERATFLRALDRAIAQDDGKRLRAAVEKLLDHASEGQAWALDMLANRLDGRPAQSIDMHAVVSTRKAAELSDDELAEIANASRSHST